MQKVLKPAQKKIKINSAKGVEKNKKRYGINGVNVPLCISDSQCEMEYIFMMRFLLSDSTGELVANVWRRDAVSIIYTVKPLYLELDGMFKDFEISE